VPLEMAVWTGVSPFTGWTYTDYLRLIDARIFGNAFGAYSLRIHGKQLSKRMSTHHTLAWRNIKCVTDYALEFLRKNLNQRQMGQ